MAVYGKRPAYIITFNLGEFKQWIFTPGNTDEEMETIFRDYMNK